MCGQGPSQQHALSSFASLPAAFFSHFPHPGDDPSVLRRVCSLLELLTSCEDATALSALANAACPLLAAAVPAVDSDASKKGLARCVSVLGNFGRMLRVWAGHHGIFPSSRTVVAALLQHLEGVDRDR